MWGKSRKPGNPFFWGGRSDDKLITGAWVDYLIKQTGKTAKIYNLHPHALRHTAATLAIRSGVPLHDVQAKLGHSTIMMTSRYLHC